MKTPVILLSVILCSQTAICQRAKFHHNLRNRDFFGNTITYLRITPASVPPLPVPIPPSQVAYLPTNDLAEVNPGKEVGVPTLYPKWKGILTVSGGKCTIDFWSWKNGEAQANLTGAVPSTEVLTIAEPLNTQSFEIKLSRADLTQTTNVLYIPFGGWNYGLATVPLRIRYGRESKVATASALSGMVFIGRSYGLSSITHRGMNNLGVNIGGFFGLSSATLKTSEFVKDDRVKYPSVERTDLTLLYGAQLQVARNNIGLIFTYGIENATGPYASSWIYQYKPFIGFGITSGFTL